MDLQLICGVSIHLWQQVEFFRDLELEAAFLHNTSRVNQAKLMTFENMCLAPHRMYKYEEVMKKPHFNQKLMAALPIASVPDAWNRMEQKVTEGATESSLPPAAMRMIRRAKTSNCIRYTAFSATI